MAKPFVRRKVLPENPVVVGAKFARLLIIEDGWEHVGSSGWVADVVKVRCDCGTEKFVRPSALTRGVTLSCGCLQKEQARALCASRAKHGDAGGIRAPEYGVYRTMLSRCDNPNVSKYEAYGGRGITVCARWRGEQGYSNFRKDMGRRPSGCSIERINNNGNYEPSNCRWATASEQANNRRSNQIIEFGGRRQTLMQWSREVGLKSVTIHDRLARGWDVQRALFTPVP